MSKKIDVNSEDFIKRCLTCKQGKWEGGKHICKRKVCKYEQPSKASSYFIRYGDDK